MPLPDEFDRIARRHLDGQIGLLYRYAADTADRLTHDLEAADIDIQHWQPAHGATYLSVFAETSNALLARLEADHYRRN
jgi:hypothetical protein